MSRYFTNNSYYFITVPTAKHFPFFDTPEKKSLILEKLNNARKVFKLDNFDYGIISNHYHFVSYFYDGNIIPRFLQRINGGSAYSLNKITGNKKPVWDEYYIYLIEDEILLDKIRGYVVGNPLKHGEVKTLKELERYPFSSYYSLVKKMGKETVGEFIRSVILLDDKEFIRENMISKPTRLKSVGK